jgi:hypothetical protein
MSIAGAGLSKWEEASQQRAAFSVGETANYAAVAQQESTALAARGA